MRLQRLGYPGAGVADLDGATMRYSEPLSHSGWGDTATEAEAAARGTRDNLAPVYYVIGGILAHGRSLTAFTNPSTNSYRRLVPGYEAPVNLAYSQRNRSAAVRIPMYSPSPKAKRVEFRCPDPSCNSYLTFSADNGDGEDVFYYLTAYNENYVQPPKPDGVDAGILEGMYRFADAPEGDAVSVELPPPSICASPDTPCGDWTGDTSRPSGLWRESCPGFNPGPSFFFTTAKCLQIGYWLW